LPSVIKIDPYNFELYRFKVGAFFETQCIGNVAACSVCHCSWFAVHREGCCPWPWFLDIGCP